MFRVILGSSFGDPSVILRSSYTQPVFLNRPTFPRPQDAKNLLPKAQEPPRARLNNGRTQHIKIYKREKTLYQSRHFAHCTKPLSNPNIPQKSQSDHINPINNGQFTIDNCQLSIPPSALCLFHHSSYIIRPTYPSTHGFLNPTIIR